MNKRIIWFISATFLILTIPVFLFILKFGSWTFSKNLSDWNTFSGYIGGLLGTFISFLSLLVTIYITYLLNEYDIRKSQQLKESENVKAYLELYKYFVGHEFREKRTISWKVLKTAIENPEYSDFLVNETYIIGFEHKVRTRINYDKFKHIYKDENYEESEFFIRESEDRHKLDDVLTFFQLLAITDVPKNNYLIFDFYYDHWRAMLLWYSKKLEEGYEKIEADKKFNNPPKLRTAIELLDQKYFNPKIPNDITFENVTEHPIIAFYSTTKFENING
jgi:hypothetical protein